MKIISSSLIFCVIFFIIPFFSIGAQSFSMYHHFHVDNEVFPVLALFNSAFAPENLSQEFSLDFKWERGYQVNYWHYYLGIVFIEEQQVKIPGSTLLFLEEYLYETGHTHESYPVSLKEFSQSVEGFAVGGQIFSSEKWGLDVVTGLKYLQGQEIIKRNYRGQISYHEDTYHLLVENTQVNSHMVRESKILEDTMCSQGFSLDVALSWKPVEDLLVFLTGENFYSHIRWKDVLTIKGTYGTNNLHLDEEGYFFYVPIFQPGSSWTYEQYHTSLCPEYVLALQYKDRVELGVYHRQVLYPYVSFLILSDPIQVRAGLFKEMFMVSGEYRGLTWEFKSPNFNLEKSTTIIGRLGWTFNF